MVSELDLRIHELEADVEIYDNEVDKLELSLLNCAKGFEDMSVGLDKASTILVNAFGPVIEFYKEMGIDESI